MEINAWVLFFCIDTKDIIEPVLCEIFVWATIFGSPLLVPLSRLKLQPFSSVLTSCPIILFPFPLPPSYPATRPFPPPILMKDTVLPCPEGSYSLGLAQSCTPCQVGYSCNSPESDLTNPCPWGTFAVGGKNACTDCPAGFTCRCVYC